MNVKENEGVSGQGRVKARIAEISDMAEFTAARIGRSEPEDLDFPIVIGKGHVLEALPRAMFSVLTEDGWERFFSPRGTSIRGPAIVSGVSVCQPNEGIFRKGFRRKFWARMITSCALTSTAIFAPYLLGVFGSVEVIWPGVLLLIIATIVTVTKLSEICGRNVVSDLENELSSRVSHHLIFQAA